MGLDERTLKIKKISLSSKETRPGFKIIDERPMPLN